MQQLLPYSGLVSLSGSKSIIQRIMLICSVHRTRIELTPGSVCDDVLEMAEALKTLNIMVIVTPDKIIINSECMLAFEEQTQPVCFKASATAFRFWLARALICKASTVLTLSEQLYNRPWKEYIPTLESCGCELKIREEIGNSFPYRLEISPATQKPAELDADSSFSSQFISGLMLIAPVYGNLLTIKYIGNPVSSDYIKLTCKLMNSIRFDCESGPDYITLHSETGYHLPQTYQVEPDMSSAAFFLALGALSEKGITLETVSFTRWQPDWKFVQILRDMGAEVDDNNINIFVSANQLHGIQIDMQNNPDLVPVLAVLALFADTESVFYNIGHLRFKESDRIAGLINALRLIGADCSLKDDNLLISPLKKVPESVTLDTQSDHRLVMAFTLLQLHYPQVFLSEKLSVEKSCPDFYPLLESLLNEIVLEK